MKIEHVGLWVKDLEEMKEFYNRYFDSVSNDLYHNQTTGFRSYFLSFESGCRLELMNKTSLSEHPSDIFGYAHIALTIGDKQAVDDKITQLTTDGYLLLNGPRITGDGYYEAVIQDPEGNLIELMAN